MELDFIRALLRPSDSKIILLILDGLGGLPRQSDGLTELEAAYTPNLDRLAAEGVCGLHQPIAPGVTPGSGPAHLAVFGYDPVKFQVGRGVLSALGIDFELKSGDVAARGNFCTIDSAGLVTDRRAGRIPTEKNRELCAMLKEKVRLPGAELFVEPEKEHRFMLALRGEGLNGEVHDTDPQQTGKAPLAPKAVSPEGEKTAQILTHFVKQAREVLKDQLPANMTLLRGFSKRPDWPLFGEAFGLKAAAIATYPMYKGVSKLLGMEVIEAGETLDSELKALEKRWGDYDFFYFHVKKTDSAGEDGDFDRKMRVIEDLDTKIPRMMALKPAVLIVTGDHSTPSQMRSHSWHPVPALIWSKFSRADRVEKFGESACRSGSLGANFPAVDLIPLALANAGRLEKFGA